MLSLPCPSLLIPLGELLRISCLTSQQPQLPSDPTGGRGRGPQRRDSSKVTQQVGQCQLGASSFPSSAHLRILLPIVGPAHWPCCPHTLVTAASAFAGPGNPYHQQLPAFCVPSGHPGESLFSCPPHKSLLPASQASFRLQECAPSELPPTNQVPSNFRLQILPGDEIVQVNEQVVVSEERDMVGVKGYWVEPRAGGLGGTFGETRVWELPYMR